MQPIPPVPLSIYAQALKPLLAAPFYSAADPKKLVLILGDMGELGNSCSEGHRSVCALAKHLFPASRFIVVGPNMTDAAAETGLECMSYPSAQNASDAHMEFEPGSLIFLKGSRSTHLELVEPAGD